MDYWLFYALGLTGLIVWWANKERNKGLNTSVATEDGKSAPLLPGLGVTTKAPVESYTRDEFLAQAAALHGAADYQAYYTPKDAGYAVAAWDAVPTTDPVSGAMTDPTLDRTTIALAWRTAAHDGRLSDSTRRLFERASRMMRYAAIAGDKVDPKKTMATIDAGFSAIDASGGLSLPSLGSGGAYEGFEDTVKDGTYSREKFALKLDELLATPEVVSELTSVDAATGVTVNQAAAARASSLKIWDDGPTAARAAFAIDDYAAGRGVEPQPDATGTTVVWAKSGTPTSKTDPYSPDVASKLLELAMAMRWRAVSAAENATDAENTRAAIDEVFSRIDVAAA